MKVVAVSGCLGFIGSHLVEALVQRGYYVYGLDNETYAANTDLLETWRGFSDIFKYQKADIVTLDHLPDVDAIINLAAETHVDNSIRDSRAFVRTNVLGVQNLLELVRSKRQYEMPRFVQISTDEVYGDVEDGVTGEDAPLNPSSPYAASKAAADLLVQSYARTHRITYQIIRPSNNYGPRQYPEKLIPKAVRYFKLGKQMPVHAGGTPVRSWLHVKDCAEAIIAVLEKGAPNTTYNIAGNTQASVSEVLNAIAREFPDQPCTLDTSYERAGLDTRYCVSDARLRNLGWESQRYLFREIPGLVASERRSFRW